MRKTLALLLVGFAALFLLGFAALFVLGFAARADEAPATIEQLNQQLGRARATLDEVGKMLAEPNVAPGTLRLLRDRVEPLPHELDEVIEKLAPRLKAVEARLKELSGPPPETKPPAPATAPAEAKPTPAPPAPPPKAPEIKPPQLKPAAKPPEAKAPDGKTKPAPGAPAAPSEADLAAASAAAERAEQQTLFAAIDATLKRARALQIEARQTLVTIVARQRAQFAKTLFLRTSGLFSPDLWRDALSDAPGAAADARDFLRERAVNFASRLASGRWAEFFALLALIALAIPPALLVARRVLGRIDGKAAPSRLAKSFAAAWFTLAAAVPIASVAALFVAMRGFDLVDASLDPILQRVFEGVARVTLSYALARAVFAPAYPLWRLADPGDALAKRFVFLALSVATTIALVRIVEQLEETVEASLQLVIATRGAGAMIVAILVGASLLRFPRREAAGGAEALERVASADILQGRDWLSLTRAVGVFAVAVIAIACVFGFVTFANFFILQAGWIAAVVAVLYIALGFAGAGVEAAFEPSSLLGRVLTRGLGVRREQLAPTAVVISGVATLACYVAAALVALAPFGVESGDFLAGLRSAFFAFKIGDVTISPAHALTGLVLFLALVAATQGLRRWLDTRYLPLTRLDAGLRNSIGATLGYAGFLLAVGVSLSYVGLSLEKLAIVAGALSVGIGFGLQSIVNNFVSGLILLWERAIRVGDWVVLGEEQGYVKRINVRSTEIETFDRATMVVPNSNLVAGVVKNWLRADKVGRIKIALAPHSGVDPERIRDVLLSVARRQEGVLRIPAPQVMFLGMEAGVFRFELWCYVEDVEQATRVRSDLHFDLHKRLAQEGISIAAQISPPPPTIVQLPGLEKLAAAVSVGAFALGEATKDDEAESGARESADPQNEPGEKVKETA